MVDIIVAIIGLLTAVVTAFLVPYINAKLKNEKYKATATKIYEFVKGAEQIFGAKTGEQKKEYVVKMLKLTGVDITEEIETIIEAAVYSLQNIGELIEFSTDQK